MKIRIFLKSYNLKKYMFTFFYYGFGYKSKFYHVLKFLSLCYSSKSFNLDNVLKYT